MEPGAPMYRSATTPVLDTPTSSLRKVSACRRFHRRTFDAFPCRRGSVKSRCPRREPSDAAVERFQKAHRITVRDNVHVRNVVENRKVLRFHSVQYMQHVFERVPQPSTVKNQVGFGFDCHHHVSLFCLFDDLRDHADVPVPEVRRILSSFRW